MGLIAKDVFVCLDCEATGLDIERDRVIEIALIKFTFSKTIDSFETLVDPECPIPPESQLIHNISSEMVQGKPKIQDVLGKVFDIIGDDILVGHGILFDVNLIKCETERHSIPFPIKNLRYIDTLRLARLYGESPTNSLETLRRHFNIAEEGAHRAMSDVLVNISVFKQLSKQFKTTEELLKRLEKPILLRAMPLGKHKGRKFSEIPIEYILWAVNQDFDQDLIYSLKMELKKRHHGSTFTTTNNPFSIL